MNEYELYHFGVRGMKWGVRRYQNPDGSYKPGAEGRYAPDSSGERENREISSRANRIAKERANSGNQYKDYSKDGKLKRVINRKLYGIGKDEDYVEKMKRIQDESDAEDEMIRENQKKKEADDYSKAREKNLKFHNSTTGEGREESDEIVKRADRIREERLKSGYKYKTKDHRGEDESAAEDEMIREYQNKKKADKIAKEQIKNENYKKKKEEKFLKEVDRSWYKTYNETAKNFKKEEKRIKEKYKDKDLGKNYDTAEGQKLIKELDKAWKDTYRNSFGKQHSSKLSELGRSVDDMFLDNMPGYNMYDDILKAKHSDYSEYELYHHGILGMKWGIRRYQNPDGSYTEAGKKRYSVKDTVKKTFHIYKPGEENPVVSEKTKKRRDQEYAEYNAAKEKERKYKEEKAAKKAEKDAKQKARQEKIKNNVKTASKNVSDILGSPEVKRGSNAMNGLATAVFGLKIAKDAKNHGTAADFLIGAGLSLAGSAYAGYNAGMYRKNKEYLNSNSLYQRKRK